MEWVGCIGEENYTPPFSCTEGRLISIINISSIDEYCYNWGSNCPCSSGLCTSLCSVRTMEAFPSHYDQILGCNGTTDCSTLTPPETEGSCYWWDNHRVDFIQIIGVCDTGTITLPFTIWIIGLDKALCKIGAIHKRLFQMLWKLDTTDAFGSPI